MAKRSQIDRVIAEWQNEKIIVEVCAGLIDGIVDGAGCVKALAARASMLNEMICRASTIDEGKDLGPSLAKPTRTRKSRKAHEFGLNAKVAE